MHTCKPGWVPAASAATVDISHTEMCNNRIVSTNFSTSFKATHHVVASNVKGKTKEQSNLSFLVKIQELLINKTENQLILPTYMLHPMFLNILKILH